MNESRRRAYECLVSDAFIEIRNGTSGWAQARWWNPMIWKANLRIIKRAHLIADVFETLADHLPSRLETFDEERFWDIMKGFEKHDSYLAVLRERFDLELQKAQQQ